MKKIIIFSLFVLMFGKISYAQDQTIVLNGLPLIQNKASFENSSNAKMTESQSNEYRLLIIKHGDNYFWASRNNKQLILRISGAFHIFIEPGGAGYIKIMNSDEGALYMEHMSIGLQTVTYWGMASSFNP